jgi:hypothetical protein
VRLSRGDNLGRGSLLLRKMRRGLDSRLYIIAVWNGDLKFE